MQHAATAFTPPARSESQRRLALAEANRIRSFRAAAKRHVKHGQADPVGLVLFPPEEMLTMKLDELLLQIPKVGRVKANRILFRTQCSPSKTLGGLTERQRRALAAELAS